MLALGLIAGAMILAVAIALAAVWVKYGEDEDSDAWR